ncbi:MAG: hypothetical protein J5379_02010 [Clostridiales bacterium]|nr:hypothetical protein [Clostridiales bacterium]
MDWKTAGQTIPEITTRDLVVFRLPPEEAEQLAHQYNRALYNMNNDGADVAIISLKKIITDHPDWGDASLVFGICVAQCGEYHRSLSCFEHALTCGLHSQSMTELAQFCLAQAKEDTEKAQAEAEQAAEEESPLKALSAAITRQESPMIAESEHRERIHVQAPILIKAPKKPRKRRIATEKEIRDALAQSTSSNGEIPDEEIMVDFPKTPAEKMRMTVIGIVIVAILIGLFCLIRFVIVPAVSKASEKSKAAEKVEFLVDRLSANQNDPECATILSEYQAKYGEAKTDNGDVATTTPADSETEGSEASGSEDAGET